MFFFRNLHVQVDPSTMQEVVSVVSEAEVGSRGDPSRNRVSKELLRRTSNVVDVPESKKNEEFEEEDSLSDDFSDIEILAAVEAIETKYNSMKDEGKHWPCPRCTLINCVSSSVCNACRCPAPHRGNGSGDHRFSATTTSSSSASASSSSSWPIGYSNGRSSNRSRSSSSAAAAAVTSSTTCSTNSGGRSSSSSSSSSSSRFDRNMQSLRSFRYAPAHPAGGDQLPQTHMKIAPTSRAPPPRTSVDRKLNAKRAAWKRTFDDHWAAKFPPPDSNERGHLQIDGVAAKEYVYPTNMQVREDQLAAVEAALFENTLVVLPTGLGKTFIAAVVMYNMYRWFPEGKIVFMAPTKPLVEQQVEACYKIVGIPPEDTAELQGRIKPADRVKFWRDRRVFFCTPQTFANDLKKGRCDAVVKKFACVVVDEAHKATGKYAYCNVVRYIRERNAWFRVLALSATPGKELEQVQNVANNLLISKIVARSDADPDVKKYKHTRLEDVVKVKLPPAFGNLESLFLRVMDAPLNRLKKLRVLSSCTPSSVTAMKIIHARNGLMVRMPNGISQSHRGLVMGLLSLIQNLVNAKKMLRNYGLRSFYDNIQEIVRKARQGDNLRRHLVELPTFQNLRRTLAHMVNRGVLVHPKLAKTVDILRDHFGRAASFERKTSAIVFVQFRAAVAEIVKRLKQYDPLIKARAFVGQSSGAGGKGRGKQATKKKKGRLSSTSSSRASKRDGALSSTPDFVDCVAMRGQNQAQQKQTIVDFREGKFNTLVATCIAEEGLDIGAVDLIISFDALTSPIRMVQRRGRTGRKRAGRSVVLLTEGIDERKYRESNRLAGKVMSLLKHSDSYLNLRPSVRMIPSEYEPKLVKREMVFREFRSSQVGGREVSNREDIRERKRNVAQGTLTKSQSARLDTFELTQTDERLDTAKLLLSPSGISRSMTGRQDRRGILQMRAAEIRGCVSLSSATPHRVAHSRRSLLLRSCLTYIEDEAWRQDERILYQESNVNAKDDTTNDGENEAKRPLRKQQAKTTAKVTKGGPIRSREKLWSWVQTQATEHADTSTTIDAVASATSPPPDRASTIPMRSISSSGIVSKTVARSKRTNAMNVSSGLQGKDRMSLVLQLIQNGNGGGEASTDLVSRDEMLQEVRAETKNVNDVMSPNSNVVGDTKTAIPPRTKGDGCVAVAPFTVGERSWMTSSIALGRSSSHRPGCSLRADHIGPCVCFDPSSNERLDDESNMELCVSSIFARATRSLDAMSPREVVGACMQSWHHSSCRSRSDDRLRSSDIPKTDGGERLLDIIKSLRASDNICGPRDVNEGGGNASVDSADDLSVVTLESPSKDACFKAASSSATADRGDVEKNETLCERVVVLRNEDDNDDDESVFALSHDDKVEESGHDDDEREVEASTTVDVAAPRVSRNMLISPSDSQHSTPQAKLGRLRRVGKGNRSSKRGRIKANSTTHSGADSLDERDRKKMRKKKRRSREERILSQRRREKSLLEKGFLLLEAECSDDDERGEGWGDNDALDRDLSGFIDDSTPNKSGSSSQLSQNSGDKKNMYWQSVMETPVQRRMRRSSRRALPHLSICRTAMQSINDSRVHRGYACDACGINPIQGLRFHCDTCGDVDFCEACAVNSDAAATHETHTLLKYSQVVADSQLSQQDSLDESPEDDVPTPVSQEDNAGTIEGDGNRRILLKRSSKVSLLFNGTRCFGTVAHVARARIHIAYDDGTLEKIPRSEISSRKVRLEKLRRKVARDAAFRGRNPLGYTNGRDRGSRDV